MKLLRSLVVASMYIHCAYAQYGGVSTLEGPKYVNPDGSDAQTSTPVDLNHTPASLLGPNYQDYAPTPPARSDSASSPPQVNIMDFVQQAAGKAREDAQDEARIQGSQRAANEMIQELLLQLKNKEFNQVCSQITARFAANGTDLINGFSREKPLGNSDVESLYRDSTNEAVEHVPFHNIIAKVTQDYYSRETSPSLGAFQDDCKRQLDSFYGVKRPNVSFDQSLSLQAFLDSLKKSEGDGGQAPVAMPQSDRERDCVNPEMCALTEVKGDIQRECNLFKCTLTGQADDVFVQLGSHLMLSNSNFQLKGDEHFCNKCFERQAATQSKFREMRDKLSERLANAAAGNRAAQKLGKILQVMETRLNYGVIENNDDQGFNPQPPTCSTQFESLMKNKCKNDGNRDLFDGRFQAMMSSAYMLSLIDYSSRGAFVPENILEALEENFSKEVRGCNRQDYALYNANNWLHPSNNKKRIAFNTIMDLAKKEELLQPLCEPEGEESVKRWETPAKIIARQLAKKVSSTLDAYDGDWAIASVCSKLSQDFNLEDLDVKSALCKDDISAAISTKTTVKAKRKLIKKLLSRLLEENVNIAIKNDPHIAVNLRSKNNACKLYEKSHKENKSFSELVSSNHQDYFEDYIKESCEEIISSVEHELCEEKSLDEIDPKDIEMLRADVIESDEDTQEGLAFNSLLCNSRIPATGVNGANKKRIFECNAEWVPLTATDFEVQSCGRINKKNGSKDNLELYEINSFNSFAGHMNDHGNGCGDDFDLAERNTFNALLGKSHFNVRPQTPEEQQATAERNIAIIDNQNETERRVAQSISSRQESSRERRRSSSANPTPISSPLSLGSSENENIRRSPAATAPETQVANENFQNNFWSNEEDNKSGPSSYEAYRTQQIINSVRREQREVTDREVKEIAEELELKDFENNNKSIREVVKEIVQNDQNSGASTNELLAELMRENRALREEMKSIREELNSKPENVKILDKNGKEIGNNVISQPQDSSQTIYNPRNPSFQEFRSREFFNERAEEFSPTYSEKGPRERVSLGEYSNSRRSAIRDTSVENTKKYNATIDNVFLQANSGVESVDSNYVKSYVEHVRKSAGSIEHLVVFEGGVPVKIRVPDPSGQGEYIEYLLDDDLAKQVLLQVEEDETNSYAVYNMLSFGESLNQFMQKLEDEESNLTTLSQLNATLEQAKKMEQ